MDRARCDCIHCVETANIINIPTQLIKGRVKEAEGREITVQVRAHALHMPIHPAGYLQTVADYYGVLTCMHSYCLNMHTD